jgi:hypothetical protein
MALSLGIHTGVNLLLRRTMCAVGNQDVRIFAEGRANLHNTRQHTAVYNDAYLRQRTQRIQRIQRTTHTTTHDNAWGLDEREEK